MYGQRSPDRQTDRGYIKREVIIIIQECRHRQDLQDLNRSTWLPGRCKQAPAVGLLPCLFEPRRRCIEIGPVRGLFCETSGIIIVCPPCPARPWQSVLQAKRTPIAVGPTEQHSTFNINPRVPRPGAAEEDGSSSSRCTLPPI
jgi:hypothetical protein